MITINLMQESVDVTCYQNILANSVVIPTVLILGLAVTLAISLIRDTRRKTSHNEYYRDELGNVADGCVSVFFMLLVSIGVLLIPVQFLSVKITDTPHGDNAFFDRVSYVAYDTAPAESKHRTLKEDFHDKIKEAINNKKSDLEKYGLDSDACESHKRSTNDVSMLCGGDSLTDVHTLSHDIHIAVGNTTEINKDSIPHNHVEVKDGEELFWASLVINNS